MGKEIFQFFNVMIVYYGLQLVRCALLSYAVFAVVFFLRQKVFYNRIFLKGALWSLFLPVLFVGRMKFFYENKVGGFLFSWWTAVGMRYGWISWLYVLGIFIYGFLLFHRRRRLKKLVCGMEKRQMGQECIYVAKMPVSPSTVGVFVPRIVMPEIILSEYGEEEVETILLHEKVHIHLGHLLFYFLWDILRALLWINPLLTFGTGFFRQDMEEICDWVTIRKSGKSPFVYGQLLVKSMRLLQAKGREFHMYAAFVGDQEYGNIRQRMTRIAGYRPYQRMVPAAVGIAAAFCILFLVGWTKQNSYARSSESDSMLVYGYDNGETTFFNNDNALSQMIDYDESYVYVQRDEFENFLSEREARGEIYIVFGGYQKLPGFGSGGYSCMYEDGPGEIIRIAYEKPEDSWMTVLFRLL